MNEQVLEPGYYSAAPLEIDGAFLIVRSAHEDERGFFAELHRQSWDIPMLDFVQQNMSFSWQGVLRGMHSQGSGPQGKLITCVFGSILDVIYDARKDSPTFGKGFARQLDWTAGESLYAPPGCLHGFLVLSQHATVLYNCTSYYDQESDGGARWDSPEIVGLFPMGISPKVSAKDAALPLLADYLKG